MKGGEFRVKAGIFPRNGRKGQALVEFAIALPLLVLIMFGVLDLGRAFFAFITIHNAAREGARYGTLNPRSLNLVDIREAAREEARNSGISPVDPEDLIVTYSCPSDCRDEPITVTVSYTFRLAMGLLPEIFPGREIVMSRSIHMLMP